MRVPEDAGDPLELQKERVRLIMLTAGEQHSRCGRKPVSDLLGFGGVARRGGEPLRIARHALGFATLREHA